MKKTRVHEIAVMAVREVFRPLRPSRGRSQVPGAGLTHFPGLTLITNEPRDQVLLVRT
jgi:hypothetical protein